MNVREKQNLYIVWNPFQRRAESLAKHFNLKTVYVHYEWEERNKLFKAFSYIPKSVFTLITLYRHKPGYVFIQLAPTPLLYTAAFYSLFSKCRYISDCHNTMLYDDHWIRWPFAKFLLRKSLVVLTHNDDVKSIADNLSIPTVVLRDPLPIMEVDLAITEVAGVPLKETVYVIIPGSMAADEPVRELFDAAAALPDVLFFMTWYNKKLSEEMRVKVPGNIRFTGFLEERHFNALYANANAALVLTTREGTQPSGAAEAIALGVPLVVSNIETTARLYGSAPVYVNNEPKSIVEGVVTALNQHDSVSTRIQGLRHNLVTDANSQTAMVRQILNELG